MRGKWARLDYDFELSLKVLSFSGENIQGLFKNVHEKGLTYSQIFKSYDYLTKF